MRVLFIPSRFPQDLHRGDELRAYQYLRELAPRHAITVLAFAPRGAQTAVQAEIHACCERVVTVEQSLVGRLTRAFRALPVTVPLQAAMNDTPAFRDALTQLLRVGQYDVAHVQLARMGEVLPLFGELPCVLDLVDALSLNMARRAGRDTAPMRWLAAFEAARLRSYERNLCKRAAVAVVSSESDRTALDDGLSAPHVVANGIDADRFIFSTREREPDRLVFSGNLGYFPNVDAATWLAHEVLPLLRARHPRAEVDLVGARPAAVLRRLARSQPGLRLIGSVADMPSHLSRAAVALAPMRTGSGQQIKILEAMGCGTPVVATSLAAAGLDAVAGRDLLVADDALGFAEAASKLLDDRELAARLARSARKLVERRYLWRHSAMAIERHWRQAANRGSQPRDVEMEN